MIKFYRKVRKRLLSEGKIKSYFKYAIGEIILVVIGILIAITLNDYNTQKNERNLIKKKLKSLRQEIFQDSIDISILINRYTSQRETGLKLISQINNSTEKIDCEKFISDLLDFEKLETVLNNKSTYVEMVNEGVFSKIENNELKHNINMFYKYNDIFERASWEYLENIGEVRNHLINNNIILLKYHQKKNGPTLNTCDYKKYISINVKNREAFENYIYRIIEVREIIKEFYLSLNKILGQGIPVNPRN